jgi:hypothetical protein
MPRKLSAKELLQYAPLLTLLWDIVKTLKGWLL